MENFSKLTREGYLETFLKIKKIQLNSNSIYSIHRKTK